MKTPTGTSETASSNPPKKRVGPITFFSQVRAEGRKVTWTTRKETMVASTIREQAEMQGLSELIEEIEVPTEEVVEVVRGRKRTVEKRHMPGYVLVKMKMTDEAYHLIKNTPKVTGFLGAEGGKKPLPVPQAEVDRILGKIEAGATERPRAKIQFSAPCNCGM